MRSEKTTSAKDTTVFGIAAKLAIAERRGISSQRKVHFIWTY
jgi:hypothetical protein